MKKSTPILKQSILLLLLLSCTQFTDAQKIKIDFEAGTWFEILEQAQEENKYIFVDVYADYCPPCKMLENNVFTDQNVGLFYNENFINYKVNLSNRDNTYFQDLHTINQLPALLFFDSDGTTILKEEVGCPEIMDFIEMGQEVLQEKAMTFTINGTPEYLRLTELKKIYDDGTHYPKLLHEYAYLLKQHRQPYNSVVNEYLKTEQKRARVEHNRKFIYDFAVINIENMAIDFFVKDIVHFKERYGGEKVNQKIKSSIHNSVLTAVRLHDNNLFKKAVDIIKKTKLPDSDKFLFEMQSLFYQGTDAWNTYAKVAYKYLNEQKTSDPDLLNYVAAKFYKYISHKKMLKAALKWSRKSIKIENEYENNHTYAALLYKLNKKHKAIEAAENAIYIAQLRGDIDYAPTLRLLDWIKSHEQ